MQRKVFGAEFKAKVALEALAGRRTVNEIAGAYGVHPQQVATGKRAAQHGLKALSERLRGRRGVTVTGPDHGLRWYFELYNHTASPSGPGFPNPGRGVGRQDHHPVTNR